MWKETKGEKKRGEINVSFGSKVESADLTHKDAFELEMGHIWYQGLRELKVTHRRQVLPLFHATYFTFPEVFSLPAFFSPLATTCRNKLRERWAEELFLGIKFLTVCCSSSPRPSEGTYVVWHFKRNRRAAMGCWQKRFGLLKLLLLPSPPPRE